MASVELTVSAVESLDRLIMTHSLPADTRSRLARLLRVLESFPRLGPSLGGAWTGTRFVLGPWRWMLVIYLYEEERDRVVVVAIEDGRSSRFSG